MALHQLACTAAAPISVARLGEPSAAPRSGSGDDPFDGDRASLHSDSAGPLSSNRRSCPASGVDVAWWDVVPSKHSGW